MPVALRILACPRLPELQEEAARLIRESLWDMDKSLRKILRLNSPYLKNQISLGFGEGLGQILLSLRLVQASLPETEEARLAGGYRNALIALLTEKKIWESEKQDVREGLSGLLLGACAYIGAGEVSPQSHDLDRMIRCCANRLLEAPCREEPDAFTGNAGMGAALACAWRHTGSPAYAEGTVQAFTAVKEQYSGSLAGWPESTGVLKWAARRAPKAAGIGLCALQATKAGLPETAVIREVLDLSLGSVLSETGLYWNDSLFRGNALTVLFLARAAEALQDPRLLKRAGDIMTAMTARKSRFGAYHVMEKGVRNTFDISFPEGSPGIAYAALVFEETSEKGVSG
jgi:lantibiotic modifying enzyme